jgi:homoserine kinase
LDKVVVDAPASSANLGPGFDVFALALGKPRDRVEIGATSAAKTRVRLEVVGDAGLPTDPLKNAAGAVALSIARKFELKSEIRIKLTKRVPVGIGIGSSGASSAASALAMDRLFGLKMDTSQLVRHAGDGERATSGAAHLDNVAASIMGGFVIVPWRTNDPPIRFNAPKGLAVVVASPSVKLPARKTEYARSLVPSTVATTDMVHNVSRAGTIVAGFAKGDVQMVGEGMEDAVVEVARAKMIPGFKKVKTAAKRAGAAGVCISGSGPSMLSIVDRSREDPDAVLDAMVEAFLSEGVKAEGFVTSVGNGARVIESR